MNWLLSCIGRRGYIADYFRPHLRPTDRIIGTGNTRWTPGFQHCDVAFVLPDIDDEGYVAAVLELCERERIDAVLSFSDPDVQALAGSRDALAARGITALLPVPEIVDIASDKYRTHQFLRRHGFATPRTATSPAQAAGFGFPVYVKPRQGSASKHVFLARDHRELDFFYRYQPDMIVQEEVRGQELNVQLCGDLDGRPVGVCTLRKHAMRQGETDQAETVRDPEVIDLALRLGEALGATGPLDVDVIQPNDGPPVILEVNTRFGGAYPIAHLAGADFPRLLSELALDGKVAEPDFGFAGGVVMMKRLDIVGGDPREVFRNVEAGVPV